MKRHELSEQPLFQQLWQNTALALQQCERQLKNRNKTDEQLRVIQYALYSIMQHPDVHTMDVQALCKKLRAKKEYDVLSFVMAWQLFNAVTDGHMQRADELMNDYNSQIRTHCAPEYQAFFLLNINLLQDKKGNFEAILDNALKCKELLGDLNTDHPWHAAMWCLLLTQKTSSYINYSRFTEAHEAIQKAMDILATVPLDVYFLYKTWYALGSTYYYENNLKEAVDWYTGIIDQLKKQKHYKKYYYTSLVDTFNVLQYVYADEKNRTGKTTLEKQQLALLMEAEQIAKKDKQSPQYGYAQYCFARLYRSTGEYNKAIPYIHKAIDVFKKNKSFRFVAQATDAAAMLYHQKAQQSKAFADALKAFELQREAGELMTTFYEDIMQQRLDAVTLKHEVKAKELQEKLLHQQIEAMHKEIQLTNLNLHEKIQVLDELKVYVNSLKKKELETRQLINTIARKIDSVKITENDKAVLQQKLNESNKPFMQLLSQKYPSLSNLELRMCSLFQTGMTNKELAKLYGQSEKSYEQQRYRIKKKMGLQAGENLVKHLLSFTDTK